VILIYFSKIVF